MKRHKTPARRLIPSGIIVMLCLCYACDFPFTEQKDRVDSMMTEQADSVVVSYQEMIRSMSQVIGRHKKKTLSLYGSLFLLSAIFLCYVRYRERKYRRLRERLQLQERKSASAETECRRLSQELEQVRTDHQELNRSVLEKRLAEMTAKLREIYSKQSEAAHIADDGRLFALQVRELLPLDSWEDFSSFINDNFASFVDRLSARCPHLKRQELTCAVLNLLGCSVTQICYLMGVKKNTVYDYQKNLRESLALPQNLRLQAAMKDFLFPSTLKIDAE